MKLEQFRIDNLNKLADFLENKITDEQFDIEDYRKDSGKSYAEFVSLNDCGTIGCALGWSPFVIPAVNEDFTGTFLSFDKYSERNLVPIFSDFWDYMFSDEWRFSLFQKDFSRLGTVERIRKVASGEIEEFDAYCVFNGYTRELQYLTYS